MKDGLRLYYGDFKGRKITKVADKRIRPVLSRLRFKILGMIQDFIPDARVLELYAGTGILGIESLSMGAQRVTFVDKSKAACAILEKNLKSLNIPRTRFDIIRMDTLDYLVKSARRNRYFDIIFMDPPFSDLLRISNSLQREYTLELLDRGQQVLGYKGLILLKMHKKVLVQIPQSLYLYSVEKFGINRVYVLLKKEDMPKSKSYVKSG